MQERDTLTSEHEELKIKRDELQRQHSAPKENLNAITEQRYALQRDRHILEEPNGRVIRTLENCQAFKRLS
jgi:chromosome segregation ATPase